MDWRELYAIALPRVGALSLVSAGGVRAVSESNSMHLKKWLDVNQLHSLPALCSPLDVYDVPVPDYLLAVVQNCPLNH
jgi:hypothetical protein